MSRAPASALAELQAGAPGEAFVAELARTVRAVAVARGFPPPDGAPRWDDDAVATVVSELLTDPQTPRRLADLALHCATEHALRARLQGCVRNFLADLGRRTPVGKLVVRVNEVLGQTEGFVRSHGRWARTDTTAGPTGPGSANPASGGTGGTGSGGTGSGGSGSGGTGSGGTGSGGTGSGGTGGTAGSGAGSGAGPGSADPVLGGTRADLGADRTGGPGSGADRSAGGSPGAGGTGSPAAPGPDDPVALAVALAAVAVAPVPRWGAGARRAGPVADRATIVALCGTALDAAGGALAPRTLARAIADRLGIGQAPLSLDVDGLDPPTPTAAPGDDATGDQAVRAMRAGEVLARLTDRERLSVAYPEYTVRELGPLLGRGPSQAQTIRARAAAIIGGELQGDDDGEAIALLVIELAREWAEGPAWADTGTRSAVLAGR